MTLTVLHAIFSYFSVNSPRISCEENIARIIFLFPKVCEIATWPARYNVFACDRFCDAVEKDSFLNIFK